MIASSALDDCISEGHGISLARDPHLRGWAVTHGLGEAHRFFSDHSISTTVGGLPRLVEDWLAEVHAYERALA